MKIPASPTKVPASPVSTFIAAPVEAEAEAADREALAELEGRLDDVVEALGLEILLKDIVDAPGIGTVTVALGP
jgi:hypothetical protein